MSISGQAVARQTPEPLPANIRSVQPGGGVCYQVERAWGRLRRWWLKRFRPAYVRAMAARRQGTDAGAPHEILDPRDLKDCRNCCDCAWAEADDPFRWRRRIPLAPWGAAELHLAGWPLLALTVAAGGWAWYLPYGGWAWCLPAIPAAGLALLLFFFRNPWRRVPQAAGLLVSPADGTVREITPLAHDEFLAGPAIRIGIFLSIFNVHLNRSPAAARVLALRYSPGEFLNALRPESALRNENMWIGLEEEAAPHGRLVVRQISGAIARRIVCTLRPGEVMPRGHVFGMIKLGSRTELILPAACAVQVVVGQKVKAGITVVARNPKQ
ncbi:MAG: phosphatidylserine decarboxylase [Thermoguttaceae bacterium]|jgi:phosphatidylserine decarboxylase